MVSPSTMGQLLLVSSTVSTLLLLLLFFPLTTVSANTLGIHRLMGSSPPTTPYPVVHEVSGVFEVQIDVRFNCMKEKDKDGNDCPRYEHCVIFEFANCNGVAGSCDDTISFFQKNNERKLKFEIENTSLNKGKFNVETATDDIVEGELATFKVGIQLVESDTKAEIYIYKNGVLLDSKTETDLEKGIPVNTTRDSKLFGTSMVRTDADPLHGTIRDFRFRDLTVAPFRNFEDEFRLGNFPGQPYGQGFLAFFYARFDDLTKSGQLVFDFRAETGQNIIYCGQSSNGIMALRMNTQSGSPFSVLATDAIVEGEWAFWHCGVSEANQTGFIEKFNDTGTYKWELPFPMPGNLPVHTFRRLTEFSTADMDGVVLGFRMDREHTS